MWFKFQFLIIHISALLKPANLLSKILNFDGLRCCRVCLQCVKDLFLS